MSYPRRFLSETHFNTTPIPLSPPSPPEVVVAEETDFVIILAALLCALICVVGLLAVARCAWLRRGLSGTGAGGGVGGGGGSRIANKGLKKKVLNSLPKYTYSSDIPTAETSTAEKSAVKSTVTEKSTVVEEDCVICLTEYVDGDEIRVLPQCGHRFHVRCIDTWLGSHSSCPSCRQILAVARCRKCGEFAGGGGRDGAGYTFGKPSRAATCSSSSPTFLP
ncbi:hypothetical protein Leryth_013838 [Lithospermum erythrorhizon]|nr:hypothetical protein Leryth_013838 [Lithospermum erythrorhizon]